MRTSIKLNLSKVGVALTAAMLATGTIAATYSWNLTDDGVTTNTSSGTPSFTDTNNGFQITVSAYYTTTGTSITADGAGKGFVNFNSGGNFGLGMMSPGDAASLPTEAIYSASSSSREFVVVDAGSVGAINWGNVAIGYGSDNGTGGQADLKLWAVDSLAGFNPTNGGTLLNNLVANSGAVTTTALGNLDLTGNPSVGIGSSRYLVISGDVGDAFKLTQIGGSTGSGTKAAPEPGSIALIGLGLLGFGIARKRRAA